MNEVSSPHQMDSQDFSCCASCSLMLGPESGPQLLPCLHTLCIRCFAASEKVTECPVCHEKYDPNEVIRNALLPKHHINRCESNKCSSCDNPFTSGWCVECQENLCAVCGAAHKTAEGTCEHSVHTVSPASPRPAMCLIHKQEVISSFCLMCEQLTCRQCPPLHPDHPLQLSHEALEKQTEQIRQMVQKVQQKSPSVQKSLNTLQGRLSDLDELQVRLRLDVKNTVARLCNLVLKKASKLLKEIEDVCRSEKEKIEVRQMILQRLKGKQDHVLTFTEKVLDSQDHTVLLSCKKQIHHQLQFLLEQTAFPMSTMVQLYFHSNELNVKKVLKAFGCIEAREVPFACSKPDKVPNQILTPNVKKTSPPSTTGQGSSPSVAVPQIGSRKCIKEAPKGLAPKSSIRSRLSSSSSQDNQYSGWPSSKRSWSYHPYQPRDPPLLLQSTIKHISHSGKGLLVAPAQVNMAHSTPCKSAGTGTSQAEPGSSSARPDETPLVASDIPSTRLHKDGGPFGDQSVQTLNHSPETVDAHIQRVDSRLTAPPSGSDGNKQELKRSGPSVQPLISNSDQSGLWTSHQLNLTGSLFYESYKWADMLNPNTAEKNISPVAQFDVMNSKPSYSGSDLRAFDANSSVPQNLSTALMCLNKDGITLQEVSSLEEILNVTMSENLLECENEKPDISSPTNSVHAIGLQMDSAQNSTQSFSVKEQPEAVEIADLLNSDRCPLKLEKDDEKAEPVTKIRDDEGNLVVLESLGRDRLPHVSLCRLSIRDYPSFCPPAFRVVRREHNAGFQFSVIQEDGKSVVPRCLSHPPLVKKHHCAACRISGRLFQCCVCRRAFHRDCHLPVISVTTTEQWQCALCRDFSCSRDRDVHPEPAASPCLSLYEQRKCEYLLLSLSCHKHSSALYRTATPSSPHYVDVTLVRGRLMGKITPPYRTPAEFVSDLWLLLNVLLNSSKKAPHMEHLQRFFSQQLCSVFGTDLHPSLLTDPHRGERTEGRTERTLKATRK